jgi:hypothetical protein
MLTVWAIAITILSRYDFSMGGLPEMPDPGMSFQQRPGARSDGSGPAGAQWSPGGNPEPQAATEPVLVTIGDISVTASRVFTPSGTRPLGEVSWTVTDGSVTTTGIPVWAIVCAIIGVFFFLLGLLFLLVKETTTRGAMQVTVLGPGFVHTTNIPVTSQAQVTDINARVNHARILAAAYASPQASPGDQAPGATGQERDVGI